MYTLTEIERLTGAAPRTVRYYVSLGLVPRADYRGSLTDYGREGYARVKAIKVLRAQRQSIKAIKKRLKGMALEEVEALIAPYEPKPVAPTVTPPPPDEVIGQRWERLELLPCLEIHVRQDAGDVIRRIAKEIVAKYRGVEALKT